MAKKIYSDKEIYDKTMKLVEKMEKRGNVYEIFYLLFFIQHLLDKEKFKTIVNSIENQEVKCALLKKLLTVNSDTVLYETDETELFLKKIEFNIQLNNFIKKINFLQ